MGGGLGIIKPLKWVSHSLEVTCNSEGDVMNLQYFVWNTHVRRTSEKKQRKETKATKNKEG